MNEAYYKGNNANNYVCEIFVEEIAFMVCCSRDQSSNLYSTLFEHQQWCITRSIAWYMTLLNVSQDDKAS